MQAQLDFSNTLTSQQQITGELQGFLRFRSASPCHLSFRLAWDEIPCENRVFEFQHSIEVQFTQDGESWSCEACGIESFGATPEEAAASFCEDFGVLWDEVVQQSDESLDLSAQQMKMCLLSVVKSTR